jgi:DNA modification methylase
MKIQFIPIKSIIIQDRARQEFREEGLARLQKSLSDPAVGLICPVKLNAGLQLIAGERRVKAMEVLHMLGTPVQFNGHPIPDGTIPAIVCVTEMDFLECAKMELAENVDREAFTYLEEAALTAKVAKLQEVLRRAQTGDPEPVLENFEELPIGQISRQAIREAAKSQFPDITKQEAGKAVKLQLEVMNVLEQDSASDLAKRLTSANSLNEAGKILQRHKVEETRVALAAAQGKNFTSKTHKVIHGDCLIEMPKLPAGTFDVCCTDPIYGIGADKFGDAAGKMSSQRHDYDDSFENFKRVMPQAIKEASRLLKKAAHIYLACDLHHVVLIQDWLRQNGDKENPWHTPTYPIIQFKTEGGRVPHPGYSPRRCYEVWVYAYRGGKQEYHMINDVLPCSSDRTESHGAGKPIGLLKTFLRRSAMPGDSVLDFMAGSGGILVAAHELNLQCTAIELNQADYGRCLERVKYL